MAVTEIETVPPSSSTDVGLTLNVTDVGAVSLSLMVPMPVEDVPSVALVGDVRVTANVSASSWMVSWEV